MKTLIVYDSFFGNTDQIARAIGNVLAAEADVSVVRVADVKPAHLAGLDLLIVGSPTRAFSASPATKAWLKNLPPNSLTGIKVAAFDTRADMNDVKSRGADSFRQAVRLRRRADRRQPHEARRNAGSPGRRILHRR